MAHLVFTNRLVAEGFSADIDTVLGYPRDGVNIGRGPHVPPSLGRTLRHSTVRKHPTLNQWAYEEDPVVIHMETRVPVPGTATRQTLDATWEENRPGRPTGLRAPDPEI